MYLLFSVIIFPNFEYIINSDGISYINIATNYLNGHIFQAINGYWSPLYSWLLVPFIYIWPGNLENVISTKILSIIIGLFTFIAISSILTKLSMDNYQKTITLLALLPFMLYFTFNYISPDFLVVCTLLYYMNFLMDERYRKTWLMGILTGFLGVMAFLAKSYVFFFFLIHFMVVNLFYVEKFSRDRKTIQKNFLLGLSVFLVISGLWVGMISEKYGTITIGTTGSYNYALAGPNSSGHPIFSQGLIKPPHEFSTSSWDDPSCFHINKWNPFKSTQNFQHQIRIILGNLYDLILLSFNLMFIPFFTIIMALFLFFKTDKESIKNNLVIILGTMLIYLSGYLIILVEERYLWFVLILSIILGFYTLNMLYKERYLMKKIYVSLIIVLILCLAFYPISLLHSYSGACSGAYMVSMDLKSHGIKGNIASNDHWEIMDYFGYYLDDQYYGITGNKSSLELRRDLDLYQIDYYFIWDESLPGDSLGEIVYKNQYFRVIKVR